MWGGIWQNYDVLLQSQKSDIDRAQLFRRYWNMGKQEAIIKKEGFVLKKTGDTLVIFQCPDCGQKLMITQFRLTETTCRCGYVWKMRMNITGTKKTIRQIEYTKGGEL